MLPDDVDSTEILVLVSFVLFHFVLVLEFGPHLVVIRNYSLMVLGEPYGMFVS